MKKLALLLLSVPMLVGCSKGNATIVLTCTNDDNLCENCVSIVKLTEENEAYFDEHGKVKWTLIGTANTKIHSHRVWLLVA